MIIAMKKARIVVLKDDQAKVLRSLQKQQVIMPSNFEKQQAATNNDLQRTEDSLKLLKKYQGKQKFFVEPTIVSAEDFEFINPEHQVLVDKVEQAHAEIAHLKAEVDSLDNEIKALLPFYDLEINLKERKNLKYAKVFTGFIPNRNFELLVKLVDEYSGILSAYQVVGNNTSIMIACFIEDFNQIIEGARNLGFTEFELPVIDELVKDIIVKKQNKRQEISQEIEDIKASLMVMASEIDKLKLLNDQLLTKHEIDTVIPTQTLETMYLEGWVRVDKIELLMKTIELAVDIYDLEIVDPDEGEVPPTALINKKYVEPFEAITDMFATPSYDGMDPNGVMAPWYWIIYGMMMGDAGYGLIMILFFGFLIKAKRPKGNSLRMMKVFMYSGITTIIWGVLFGSYFGFEFLPIIFVPMNEPLSMLILSIAIGTLHIITGIISRAVINFRAKRFMDALCDDLSWVFILVGGILALSNMLPEFGIPTIILNIISTVGLALVLTGVFLILVFGGRSKPSLFGKVTGGATSLYGATGIASDILSYSRILALSLSTAVISMVMNMLAGMLQTNPIGFVFSFAVYIVGHIFNIAMGLLSAYVHDGRLQYIEFYGKFYEGGGYKFEPLSPKFKYIDEIN